MSALPPAEPLPLPLSYAGPPSGQPMGRVAFNARRQLGWSGDHLFRVYVTPESLWFIRIAGSKQQYHGGGLIGALIAMYLRGRAKRKATEATIVNENIPLPDLINGHKLNHVIPLADLGDGRIEPAGLFADYKARFAFRNQGDGKNIKCSIETTEDVTAALSALTPLLPGLKVGVQYDGRKKKYVKVR